MKRTLIYLGYADPAPDLYCHLYDEVVETRSMDQITSVANPSCLILFGGGEDISPSLYEEPPSKHSDAKESLSQRDIFEAGIFAYAKANGIPMLGICRGAQLLCALSGGKVVQHVYGHSQLHLITTKEGDKFPSSSVHHQMMYPFEIDHLTIAWSSNKLSKEYVLNDQKTVDQLPSEPEIVYFPKTKSLGIQGHPEYMSEETPFVKYTQQLVRRYLL